MSSDHHSESRLKQSARATEIEQSPSDEGLELDPVRAARSTAVAGDTAEWYLATPQGLRKGPLSTQGVEELLVGSHEPSAYLVWRKGMSQWTPLAQVAELAGYSTPHSANIPPPLRGRQASASQFPYGDWEQRISAFLSRPSFFRAFGRGAGVLAALILFGSLLLLYWGWTWFTGVILMAGLFLVGEGVAAILSPLTQIADHLQANDDG